MRKISILAIILLLIGVAIWSMTFFDQKEENFFITEDFIHQWLQNENGTIATYITENNEVDSDLVKGRESLSETLGLSMIYALEKEDRKSFNTMHSILNKYFLESNGFIHWKLNKNGKSEVSANALIDDYRIVGALLSAYEKWDEEQFLDSARLIDKYLVTHNVKKGRFTDFYEQEYGYASDNITLSYIDAVLMNKIVDHGLSDKMITEETIRVLTAAPLRNGFYPKSYNVEKKTYSFDKKINIVDQSITAYHQAKRGEHSEEFLKFIKTEMKNNGVIFGMYQLETKKPIVDYESPAVYGFLILYCLELNEKDLANDIYKRMKNFQISDKRSEYFGGYSVYNNNTHVFDNIVPLLAEQQMRKE